MTDLAERLISRTESHPNGEFNPDDPYTWLDRIREVSPSVYKYQGLLFHGHTLLTRGDRSQIASLLRHPDVVVTTPRAVWVYDELLLTAPELSDRYIMVSAEFVWDAKDAVLIPIEKFKEIVTQDDKQTKELRNEKE